MNDRRTTPANGRVAASHLRGKVDAESFVDGRRMQVCVKSTNLWADADRGSLDRQLLYGDGFLVLEDRDGMAFGQAEKDGYVGYIASSDVGAATPPSHAISVRAAHLYSEPDMKSPIVGMLSFGSTFRAISEAGNFMETDAGGFIFKPHTRQLQVPMSDPASIAEMFLGTPYQWGGNTCDGLDCSGLVQIALQACGVDCPGDANQQLDLVGDAVGGNVPIQRGDLFFWKGHVAMALDDENLIHATAHSMSVIRENIETVIARIADQGYGDLLARKRP